MSEVTLRHVGRLNAAESRLQFFKKCVTEALIAVIEDAAKRVSLRHRGRVVYSGQALGACSFYLDHKQVVETPETQTVIKLVQEMVAKHGRAILPDGHIRAYNGKLIKETI